MVREWNVVHVTVRKLGMCLRLSTDKHKGKMSTPFDTTLSTQVNGFEWVKLYQTKI